MHPILRTLLYRRRRKPRPQPLKRRLTFTLMINAHISQTANITLGPIPFSDGKSHEPTEFPGNFAWTLVDLSDPTSPVPAGTLTPSGDTSSAAWVGVDGTKAKVHVEATIEGVKLAGDTDEIDWSTVAVPAGGALALNVVLNPTTP